MLAVGMKILNPMQYFHEIAVLVVPFQQIDSIHGVETGCWNEHHSLVFN